MGWQVVAMHQGIAAANSVQSATAILLSVHDADISYEWDVLSRLSLARWQISAFSHQ